MLEKKKFNIRYLFILVILFSVFSFTQSIQQYAEIGDFLLENGQKILDCKIGYHTIGKLNEEKSNVIIYPTWHGGFSEDIIKIIAKNFLLDTNKFFIIALDALGNGISSSPSNSDKQKGSLFPEFSIKDIVDAHYKVLTEYFGYKNIYGAIGGSMGGMQLFEWAVSYPGFISKILPYVGSPYPTSYDLLLWNYQHELIKIGYKYNVSEIEINRQLSLATQILAYSPQYRNQKTPREKFDEYLSSYNSPPSKIFTLEDKDYQIRSMLKHDIRNSFDGKLQKAVQKVKSQMLIIVNKQDHTVNYTPAMEFANLLNCKLVVLDNECGHIIMACEMERIKEIIHDFFN